MSRAHEVISAHVMLLSNSADSVTSRQGLSPTTSISLTVNNSNINHRHMPSLYMYSIVIERGRKSHHFHLVFGRLWFLGSSFGFSCDWQHCGGDLSRRENGHTQPVQVFAAFIFLCKNIVKANYSPRHYCRERAVTTQKIHVNSINYLHTPNFPYNFIYLTNLVRLIGAYPFIPFPLSVKKDCFTPFFRSCN